MFWKSPFIPGHQQPRLPFRPEQKVGVDCSQGKVRWVSHSDHIQDVHSAGVMTQDGLPQSPPEVLIQDKSQRHSLRPLGAVFGLQAAAQFSKIGTGLGEGGLPFDLCSALGYVTVHLRAVGLVERKDLMNEVHGEGGELLVDHLRGITALVTIRHME
jgi:hypothetical protein